MPSRLEGHTSNEASQQLPVMTQSVSTAANGPWVTLSTPSDWSWATKLWTYAFGWFLQTAVALLTFERNWPYSHRRNVWIDTGKTGKCRLVLHYPRKGSKDPGTRSRPLGLHIHGGGWVICRPEIEYRIAQRTADELGTIVVSPDYRKAPWYPYPHALLQVYTVLEWLANGGIEERIRTSGLPVDTTRFALSGGSAGANIAAALTLLCVHRPLPCGANVVALSLLYPVLDASTPYVAKLSGLDARLVLPRWFSRFMLHAYVPPPRSVNDPYVSPLVAPHDSLARFPPTAIVTAAEDYLGNEGDAFTTKLSDCGVHVVHQRFEAVGHGFDLMPTLSLARRRRNLAATQKMLTIFMEFLKGIQP